MFIITALSLSMGCKAGLVASMYYFSTSKSEQCLSFTIRADKAIYSIGTEYFARKDFF